MAKRLRDVCALPESEPLWRAGRGFVVRDLPDNPKGIESISPVLTVRAGQARNGYAGFTSQKNPNPNGVASSFHADDATLSGLMKLV